MPKKNFKPNVGRFADAHGATGARPVRLATKTFEEMAPDFRSVTEKNLERNVHLLANVEMPLYNGLEIGDDKHGQTTATMLINFGTMANLSPVLQESLLSANGVIKEGSEITSAQTKTSQYSGNTPSGKPVELEVTPDLSAGTVKLTPVIDMVALATATAQEREAARQNDKARFASAPKPNESAAKRLDVSVKYPTTTNGIGSMNAQRAMENVAKAGSQAYLMTASKKDPERDMLKQEQIKSVADTINDAYGKFLDAYKGGSGAGIYPAARDADGNVKVDKKTGKTVEDKTKDPIAKTGFDSFASMGLAVMDVKGSKVLAAVDMGSPEANADAAAKRHAQLPNIANAFNAVLSREFNKVPTMSAREINAMPAGAEKDAARDALNTKNLGLGMKLNMYMTTPQSVEGEQFSVVQPAMTMKFSPFATMVRDTVECAQHLHDGPEGPAPRGASEPLRSTIEDVYGPKILENTRTILANAGLETDAKALARETDPKVVEAAQKGTQEFAQAIREQAGKDGVQLFNERTLDDNQYD